jgi:hypothetical protein
MIDIGDMVNTIMQNNNCSSICAFLYLMEGNTDGQLYEPLHEQLHDKNESEFVNNMGTGNRRC